MAIQFNVGDNVIINIGYVQEVLPKSDCSCLAQTLVSLGYIGQEPATVLSKGTVTTLNKGTVAGVDVTYSFIQVVPESVSNPAHNVGQGITIYFCSDLDLNNSFELANAYIADNSFISCFNNSGSTLTKGSVVRQSGFNVTSQHATIALASASSIATAGVIGVVVQDIANGSSGGVLVTGSFQGINTSGFILGGVVFLSDTFGGISPTTGTVNAILAKVLNVGSSGTIFVFPAVGSGSEGTTGIQG